MREILFGLVALLVIIYIAVKIIIPLVAILALLAILYWIIKGKGRNHDDSDRDLRRSE